MWLGEGGLNATAQAESALIERESKLVPTHTCLISF